MEIKMLNQDPLFNEYYMEALSFDDCNMWLLDNIDQESLFWDIEDMRFSAYSYGLFNNNELIGLSLINFEIDDNNELLYDISIIIKPEYRKKGVGYDFINNVLEIAHKKLRVNKISAHIKNNNISSIQLFNKLGFSFKGKEEQLMIFEYDFNNKLNKKKAMG